MIDSLIHALFLLLFVYVSCSTGYLLVLALAGRFGHVKRFATNPNKKSIVVLIPCYREDHIILDTTLRAMAHDYPKSSFRVVVIADKLKPATVEGLRAMGTEVLEVDLDMKSRSLHHALTQIDEKNTDIVVILDADNVMGAGCLEKVNDAFQQGCLAVQLHRTAKNKNGPVALLDAISEEININLFRRGPAVLGLSAAPIGSGMGFGVGLLKDIFSGGEILNNPGEDREIDMQLMKRDIPMEFIDDGYVLDEKVASTVVFEKQRIRWLEAQVNHVRRFFHQDMKNAPKTATYYAKFFQNLLLPRVLFLLLFAIIFVLVFLEWFFHGTFLFPGRGWWVSCMLSYFFVLLISVPRSFYSRDLLRAVLFVPVLMLSMVKALLKIKKNRKEFLHTPKTFT